MSQPPEDPMTQDIKALWQGQELEIPTMTVQAIRMLVKDNEARQRHFRIWGLGVAVVAVGIWIWCAWTAPTPLVRLGDLIMLGWMPIMLWILYQRRPGRAPGLEASAQGLIDFYRGEIARQAPNLRLIALSMVPLVAGMGFIAAALVDKARHGHWIQLWPIAVLIVLWVFVLVTQTRRQQRRVRQRLADIDAMRG